MTRKQIYIAIGVTVAVTLGIVFIARAKKKKDYQKLQDKIEGGVGTTEKSIRALLDGVEPYHGAFESSSVAENLYNKVDRTWLVGSADMKGIEKILSGKTRNQIKAIDDAYKAKYGKDIEKDFKENMFGESYNTVYELIKQSSKR